MYNRTQPTILPLGIATGISLESESCQTWHVLHRTHPRSRTSTSQPSIVVVVLFLLFIPLFRSIASFPVIFRTIHSKRTFRVSRRQSGNYNSCVCTFKSRFEINFFIRKIASPQTANVVHYFFFTVLMSVGGKEETASERKQKFPVN